MFFRKKKKEGPSSKEEDNLDVKKSSDHSVLEDSADVKDEGSVPDLEPELKPEPPSEPEQGGTSWFGRLTSGLSKSSARLGQGITDLVTKKKLDQAMLDELEDLLIMADLGPKTATKIVEDFGRDRFGKDISEDEVKQALAQSVSAILAPVARPAVFERPAGQDGPMVVLVCGVNGAGKTTTIGKIAYDLQGRQNKSVMIAAADTFRAAAVEQLEIWAKRASCAFFSKDIGADAAAVAYESYEKACKDGADILFIDTAGRLQNKANLMAELQKIVRVLKKQNEALPHAVLLVLDATTGQNAYEQLRVFKEMIDVTGLVVTKLDGSARGGVVVGLADQFGVPIHLIGVGEGAQDLQPFKPEDFAASLVGKTEDAA